MAKLFYTVARELRGMIHPRDNKGVEHVLAVGAIHSAESTDAQVVAAVAAGALIAKPEAAKPEAAKAGA